MEIQITQDQFDAEVKRGVEAFLKSVGYEGGFEGMKREQEGITARLKAFEDRLAHEASSRASAGTRGTELDLVFQRAVEQEPHKAEGVDHERFLKFGTAAMKSASALRFRALAQKLGLGTTDAAAAQAAASLIKDARSQQDKEYLEVVSRGLAAGSFASGGALLSDDFRSEIIPLYIANTVIRKNAIVIPMPMGQMTMPRQTSAIAPGYVPETGTAAVSSPQVDQLKLSAKKLRVITPISNDLLRYAGPQTDTWVRNRLAADFAVTEDAAMIRGSAASGITGLRYKVLAANIAARTKAGSAATLQELVSDLFDMLDDLKSNNVPFGPAWRWLSSPTAFSGIGQRLNANGVFVFMDEMSKGRLLGLGYDESTSVPSNLGGGGNESEFYLLNYADVAVGDAVGLEVKFAEDATWDAGSGTIVSGLSTDQSAFVATLQSDIGLTHDNAGSIRTSIDWQVV